MRVIPLCVVLGGWLSMPAFAADADSWMQRLAKAEKQQSYKGLFVYERSGNFSSHAVWQLVDGSHTQERLLQLDGPAAEVVLQDGEVQCASAGIASQITGASPWGQSEFDSGSLSKWYGFHVIGESRVAGRATVAIAIRPLDQHRYGFELHLDRDTALPLKSLLLDENGQLLERFQFVEFSSKSIDADNVAGGQDCKPVSLEPDPESVDTPWRSDWLPDGFKMVGAVKQPSRGTDAVVTRLAYTDGLARVSVFIEPLAGAVVEDARSRMGPTVAVSKRISTADGDVMVTVVGEIPLGTAERIALSMRSGSGQATR